jgi:hypothetical protein
MGWSLQRDWKLRGFYGSDADALESGAFWEKLFRVYLMEASPGFFASL